MLRGERADTLVSHRPSSNSFNLPSVLESLEQERGMTKYQFHRWPSGSKRAPTPSVRLQAESHLHGGGLALRHFKELGCDITAPLVHVDMSEPDGAKQTLRG